MKSRKIMMIVASIVVLLSIGGCSVKHKDDTKQGKTIAASSTKDLKEDKEAIKKKQLDYLKEHEQKVIDLVKAQNSKVESVQIDWDQTQWSDGGLTTPEYYMNVYGRINHIEESGWGVDIPINEDNTLNLDEMYIGSDIRIGGRLFE
nr:lipase chaperone [Streptococcus parasanguinis]